MKNENFIIFSFVDILILRPDSLDHWDTFSTSLSSVCRIVQLSELRSERCIVPWTVWRSLLLFCHWIWKGSFCGVIEERHLCFHRRSSRWGIEATSPSLPSCKIFHTNPQIIIIIYFENFHIFDAKLGFEVRSISSPSTHPWILPIQVPDQAIPCHALFIPPCHLHISASHHLIIFILPLKMPKTSQSEMEVYGTSEISLDLNILNKMFIDIRLEFKFFYSIQHRILIQRRGCDTGTATCCSMNEPRMYIRRFQQKKSKVTSIFRPPSEKSGYWTI